MNSKLVTYRIQLLVLTLSAGIFSFQLEPFLFARGVATSKIIAVYSIVQISSVIFTLFWGKIIHESDKGYLIIRSGILIRVAAISLMCFNIHNTMLVSAVFLYFFVASCLDLANEAQLMKWTSEEHQNFGRIRMFGSLGFAISGLVAAAIIGLMKTINSVIFFALLMNMIFVLLSFFRPLKTAGIKKRGKTRVRIDASTILLLVLIQIPLIIPYCFNLIMNLHFRDSLGTTLESAIFFSGLSLLFSAGISEISAFMFIQTVIEKIGPKKTILIGLIASVVRWSLATFSHSPWTFSVTFLFHGICFAFTYMGFLTIVKKRFGNDAISKMLTISSVCVAVMSAILSQVFGFVLKRSDTFTILALFTFTCAACAITYYLVFWKNPKYRGI
ncbi:MFS transporter [Paenibacillus aestuarii]|uniref:MFS transporter n=1 Tax=Paenibacillus aestuarii TaxID=516965 RepID=A0ABW0KF79_9BACL|nr:MFS transporter [Paenibacillus aestuarii]